jgi:hypothetical protein
MTFPRNWVGIPFLLKHFAVVIDFIEKEVVEEPKVIAIFTIQMVKVSKAIEKGSPSSCKL